jgi:starvation-inducible DNA-binding protein
LSARSATDDRLRRHVPSQDQLDEQAEQLYATTDAIAERVRKIGAMALRSISDISRRQRVLDNDAAYVTPSDMPAELRDDNQQLAAYHARSAWPV